MKPHFSSETLSAYLDGESRPVERRKLEAHLETCRTCHDHLAALRGVVGAVERSATRASPPPWLAARIRSQIAAEEATRRPWTRWVRFFLDLPLRPGLSTPLATGLALMLSLVLIGQGGSPTWWFSSSLPREPRFRVVELFGDVPWVPQTKSEVAGREFVLNDNVWVQKGVSESDSVVVAAGSPQGKALLARFPVFGDLLADGSRVVMRDNLKTLELWSGS